MKRDAATKAWLPLGRTGAGAAEPPTGEAFRPEWIDFARGIRVGNIAPHERITQILKYHLEQTYRTQFITDRWGRGEYWQWICWLPRANREAKPISHGVNFGCAKLFVSADRGRRVLKSGLQIERGKAAGSGNGRGWRLAEDWDWHRLLKQCRAGSPLDAELRRLVLREGFSVEIGDWESNAEFTSANFRSARQLRSAAAKCPRDDWAGFQLYFPMPADEVSACTGYELIKAVVAVFREVVPAMNACMQIRLNSKA